MLVLGALEKMEKDWAPVNLEVLSYKETGTFIMKAAEEISQLLDDHIVMTQAMSFSPYKTHTPYITAQPENIFGFGA